MKLNFGCGNDIKDGYDNYDNRPINKQVKYINLNKLPLPFHNEYADEIYMRNIFEHLICDKYDFMQEINRILKPNGKVIIEVPVNHNVVEHNTSFFPKDYFNSMKNPFYGKLFGNIKIKYTKNDVKDIIWKIKQFIFYCCAKHIIYEFKK